MGRNAKFDDALRRVKKEYSEIHPYMAPTFDLGRFLRAYNLNAEIVSYATSPKAMLKNRTFDEEQRFPGRPRKVDMDFLRGTRHRKASFEVAVESESKGGMYITELLIGINGELSTIVPTYFYHVYHEDDHECRDSVFSPYLCKHGYRAILAVDEMVPEEQKMTFVPDERLIEAFNEIDSSRKPADERLLETFKVFKKYTTLEDVERISRLCDCLDRLAEIKKDMSELLWNY